VFALRGCGQAVKVLESWKQRARGLKVETYAVYLAYRDRRVPWYARVFAACVVGYAFSPIDLIPDPIPVLGYLDDLVLVPLGIALALKMIPPEVMAECRVKAAGAMREGKPTNRKAAAAIVTVWVLLALVVIVVLLRTVWGRGWLA
jgi:uncharacterized membrane protein YkvA (DUF1232 family)